MTKKEKQEIVKKFLLTPIFYNKNYTKEMIKNGCILTRSNYSHKEKGRIRLSKFDCDMSNVAIKFYSIIYEMKENEILDSNGIPKSKEIVGDTMCSFNTTANKYLKKQTNSIIKKLYSYWPDFLQEYRIKYHCLANFWLLPEDFGRTSTKRVNGKNSDDYMDKFLSNIINDYDTIFSNYSLYKNKYKCFNSFVNKHFLNGDNNYINNGKINFYSIKKPADEKYIVKSMISLIEARADAISKSVYSDKLYDFCISLIENGNE